VAGLAAAVVDIVVAPVVVVVAGTDVVLRSMVVVRIQEQPGIAAVVGVQVPGIGQDNPDAQVPLLP